MNTYENLYLLSPLFTADIKASNFAVFSASSPKLMISTATLFLNRITYKYYNSLSIIFVLSMFESKLQTDILLDHI
jgi:hypothetical protein